MVRYAVVLPLQLAAVPVIDAAIVANRYICLSFPECLFRTEDLHAYPATDKVSF